MTPIQKVTAHIYMCPTGCGCLWKDNRDETMSLFGPNSKSCDVCESLSLNELVPLYATPQPPAVPDWVDNLRQLAEAATKGPWHGGHGACMDAVAADYRDEHGNMTKDSFTRSGRAKLICKANSTAWRSASQVKNDMEFIAAANPKTVLLLISMLAAAQQGGGNS